ncbi:MAG TPA: AGE family epimerase/isomerase [Roseiflexaceae bacterium]|nr:AGE family epimerase/isomerase [Roseiflexaceae bacterium]HMP40711.1 AGE family epimerase/isomerase [Roseiflexaceae bacterium]
MLSTYAARYRRQLDESVIPFWLTHGLDRAHGGSFTCLDRDGSVYDTKKYIWLQGRAIWMFARLYNEYEARQEYLDAATLVCEYVRRYARDERGRYYFSLTQQGQPFFFQRKPYAAVFVMLGLLEYARATGDAAIKTEAIELFWAIERWIADPSLLDRPVLAGNPPVSNLANVMVLASMAIELARFDDDPRYLDVIRRAMEGVVKHYDAGRRILIENVALDGRDMQQWPEGRLFNPGHAIEVAWFLLHMLDFVPSAFHEQLALDTLEGSLEYGWDAEYGGLYYFMDIAGRPTLQLEANMKLWWPHTEAIYALVLAAMRTGEQRWLNWLERVDAYSFEHFADPDHGEWFGYLDRSGRPALMSKGGNYKGFFHLPRALLFSIQAIERGAKIAPA